MGLNCSSSIIPCAPHPHPACLVQKAQVYMGGRDRQGVARRRGQGSWVNLVMPEKKAGVVGSPLTLLPC